MQYGFQSLSVIVLAGLSSRLLSLSGLLSVVWLLWLSWLSSVDWLPSSVDVVVVSLLVVLAGPSSELLFESSAVLSGLIPLPP